MTVMQSLVDFSKELATAPPSRTGNKHSSKFTLKKKNADHIHSIEEDEAAAAAGGGATDKLDSMAPPLARSQQTTKPPDQFEINRITKQQLAHGRELFNRKPKRGIQYLIDTHHIGNSPQDVGRFLYHNTDLLDKVKVGEVIGARYVAVLTISSFAR